MTPRYRLSVGFVLFGGLLVGLCLGQSQSEGILEQTRARDFETDAQVVVAEFEQTTTSDVVIPGKMPPSFIRRMGRDGRTALKQAELTVAGRAFKLFLGDRPEREFYLYDVTGDVGPYWWGAWNLYSYHKIGDQYYEFAILDDGQKVGGRLYAGPLGTIKVGKGGRDLEKAEFNGSVYQEGQVSAPVGVIEEHWTGAVTECQIPVGDYTSYLLAVTYDNLKIEISNNYHTNAQGRSDDKVIIYGMQVRADKPYVLDFSNDALVVFDQPPLSETSFELGQEIKFAAVLLDPKLDVMIRGLNDTSVMVEKEIGDGEVYERPKSLDPTVVISRVDGEVVAEGTMPFG